MSEPWQDRVIVEARKATAYLLSWDHPMGRTKAKFFARFGFDLANLNDFRDALVEHAQGANDWTTEFTAFGRKYVVERPLLTPDGRNPLLRSIWFEEHDESPVRLVTAYPVGGDR